MEMRHFLVFHTRKSEGWHLRGSLESFGMERMKESNVFGCILANVREGKMEILGKGAEPGRPNWKSLQGDCCL
jgi:hypothetical protein